MLLENQNLGRKIMDIVYKGKKPELDMPYFGRQSRYFKFFKDCIEPYLKGNGVYAETNSGSVSNIYAFAKEGYKVIVNDIGEYSNCIANAVLNHNDEINSKFKCNTDWLNDYKDSYVKRAAVFGACMELYGYNTEIPQELTEELKEKIQKYIKHLNKIRRNNISAYKIYNMDLFKYLDTLYKENVHVDVMFMDFAWPWRDGTETEEYESSANTLSNVFNSKKNKINIWNKSNVIENVLKALKKADKVCDYIFLSNQSSNFPTPELLEVALLKNGYEYEVRHTMLTNATNEDNLLKENFFREYLYVIKTKEKRAKNNI